MSNFLDPENTLRDYCIKGIPIFNPREGKVVEVVSGSDKEIHLKGYELLDGIAKASRQLRFLQEAINNAIVLYEKGGIEP